MRMHICGLLDVIVVRMQADLYLLDVLVMRMQTDLWFIVMRC